MMTRLLVDEFPGKRFNTIEAAVIAITKKGLEFADIDIYEVDADGCIITWIETISVSSENNYEYYQYSVFTEGKEVGMMYNTIDEIYDMKCTFEPGKYEICRVVQTLKEYLYTETMETFEIAE